jgi:hypothetical protein
MADEVGGGGLDDINIGGGVREDTNKVTEEAVRRIQDNQKKAQQVGQEIKNDKATNNKFANFLTFLLKDIKNDHLIKQIYQVFLKTRHEETDLVHLRKSMNTIIVVWIFMPFYQNEIKDLGLQAIYQDIFTFDGDIYLTKYIDYIKVLLPKHHDNIVIDKGEFTKLLTQITEYYNLIEKLSNEKTIEFENTIKKELSFKQ